MTTERPAREAVEPAAAPPRRVADWYELFFDLVFVVVIAISAELLEHDISFGAAAVRGMGCAARAS